LNMALTKTSKALMLLGQCVPSVKQNASKIRVKRLVLDEKLLMVSFKITLRVINEFSM